MTTEKRRHRKSYDVPGAVHYLTFSCFQRQLLLSGGRASGWLLESLDRARHRCPFELWAYVIMPEHVHLLVRPADGVRMRTILRQVKQPVTRRALAYLERHRPSFLSRMADVQPSGRVTHRFWQRGGGYDRNLRSDNDVHEKIAYIHANPVRCGLVAHPRLWPWSSWRAWHEDSGQPLSVDRQNVPSRSGR